MTCEDMAQQLGTDAYAPEPECPPWATCEMCGSCLVREPFDHLPEPLRPTLMRTCGLCMQDHGMPIVVMLDTMPAGMPCGGDYWSAR